ncbi:TRAP transporter substrate-binding protein [Lacisediminimonas profundi]|uniref:TRAP transporter substrate-binding protein n=1 Tax=Lacisediminimonas profundi TaxID=2603856 RepID=UPI00124B73E6|nr:TRAP transporter substrate-binding protein [Lacisediminimonas profundi]
MNHQQPISRREFLSVARKYGLKAALFATATGATGGLLPSLGEYAIRDAHAQSKAKYKLRFGASVISPTNEAHLRTGIYEFVKRVEEKSDGEVAIQLIDKSQSCAETTCGERVINNVIHMGSSSPQNLGSVMPYSIALDWPFLWRDRTGYHNFLFSKESNRLYRDVMRKAYGIVPLFGSGEMRDILMGLKYADKPAIVSPAGLQGAKIRITNSEMIANFTQSMKMSPIPLAFTELLEGLKSGVVDATETWPGAATGFGMQSVLSQAIGVGFSPGFELVFISAKTFDAFPDKIKLVFMDAAFETMQSAYRGVEQAQNAQVGNGPNPAATSAYSKSAIKHNRLTEAQRAEFKGVGGVEANLQLYSASRKKLDQIAGTDVYGAMKEFEAKVSGKPLQPAKWWI